MIAIKPFISIAILPHTWKPPQQKPAAHLSVTMTDALEVDIVIIMVVVLVLMIINYFLLSCVYNYCNTYAVNRNYSGRKVQQRVLKTPMQTGVIGASCNSVS